ncbi:MAG: bacillithiol biosynthesis deacetylase BshB1 [Bacteroidota bacterium]|nr:bacillithiol biosynthesis deacetylase BshB1 [Bacteroidota bacterium]
MKLDILAFGAHPDDVELGCSGTLAKMVRQGKKVGIIDLTKGELGSRGNEKIRAEEAKNASEILGIHYRNNLDLGDGFFEVNKKNIKEVIKEIRRCRPSTILANAPKDRHPDHGKGADLILKANYLSGLVKIKTSVDDHDQSPHRAGQIFHYIQDFYIEPDFCIDIGDFVQIKEKAIQAFASQFYDPNNLEKETPISKASFMQHIKGRALQFGRYIQKDFAEGFLSAQPFELKELPL